MALHESATMLQSQETQRSIAAQLDFDQCRAKLQDSGNKKDAEIAKMEKQLLLAEKNHKKHNVQQAAKQRKAMLEVCVQRHVCVRVDMWMCA